MVRMASAPCSCSANVIIPMASQLVAEPAERGVKFTQSCPGLLPSLCHMLGSFNILSDGVRAYMPRCSNIIRWRPEMSAPQSFFQSRKADNQSSARGALEYFYRIGYGNRRRNTHKQVDMVGLNFPRQYPPFSFSAHLIQKFFKSFSHFTSQNIVPIFRAPYQMASCLIHAISVCSNIFHISHSTPCEAACQAAIPPLIKIRGFLAEVL